MLSNNNHKMEEKCCTTCGKNLDYMPKQNINNNSNIMCQKYISDSSVISESENYSESSDAIRRDSGIVLCNEISNKSDANIYGKIKIDSSQKVIVGNVTYVTGPVYVTQVSANINEENVTNQLVLNYSDVNLNIIPRANWMAQPAKHITPLPEKSKYVIIAHTATEDGFTEPQNALLVKLIQTFHMESQGWDDLSYNFLVGCDGNIYEGRGWNIQGAHTYGYNRKAICIAFIGCFMDHLPPVCALTAARKLILEGVRLGFIPEDYVLVGHCQCSPIESPGIQLFNEIKQWPNWRELTAKDTKYNH